MLILAISRTSSPFLYLNTVSRCSPDSLTSGNNLKSKPILLCVNVDEQKWKKLAVLNYSYRFYLEAELLVKTYSNTHKN